MKLHNRLELETLQETKSYGALELMVINDMYEEGYDYPYISVEDVKAFWVERGIE